MGRRNNGVASATPTAWDVALLRYQGLRVLFEADSSWGPLNYATTMRDGLEYRTDPWSQAALAEWGPRHKRELARHMREIYDPLIEAGLALVRTPAPDMAAVRLKHEVLAWGDTDISCYEDKPGELLGILKADVKRLLREAAR